MVFSDDFEPSAVVFEDGSEGCTLCGPSCSKTVAPESMWVNEETGEHMDRCPFYDVHPECLKWFERYSDYKNGFLWNEGGMSNQPGVYVDSIRVIDRKLNQIRQEQREDK